MGDERKVKWQFLEERERMEKYFQEGFQSYLYTLFKVLGLFFTFLKQNQESISVDSFFIWLKKHFFSPQDFFGKLRMTVYRRGESNVQTCAGYPIGY